jgi:formyltetrahydrofolate hydrolase
MAPTFLHADQHQDHDLGLFFMRVEWALNGSTAEPTAQDHELASSPA